MIKIDELLASRAPKAGEVTFIGVDGHGGSGKSTLTAYLAQKLDAEVIHTDDFASWDNPLNWWPLLIERVFQPIITGASTLSYPRSSWWEKHQPEPVIDQPVTEVMILEGVSALRKEFRPYISVGVFVETPEAECLARGLRPRCRNGQITGRAHSAMAHMARGREHVLRARPATGLCGPRH